MENITNNREVKNLPNLNQDPVDEAIQKAVESALQKHKLAGSSVVVWRDGKVVLLMPEEILKKTS